MNCSKTHKCSAFIGYFSNQILVHRCFLYVVVTLCVSKWLYEMSYFDLLNSGVVGFTKNWNLGIEFSLLFGYWFTNLSIFGHAFRICLIIYETDPVAGLSLRVHLHTFRKLTICLFVGVVAAVYEIGSTGISSLQGHSEHRTDCINYFVSLLGSMPLVATHVKVTDARHLWFWWLTLCYVGVIFLFYSKRAESIVFFSSLTSGLVTWMWLFPSSVATPLCIIICYLVYCDASSVLSVPTAGPSYFLGLVIWNGNESPFLLDKICGALLVHCFAHVSIWEALIAVSCLQDSIYLVFIYLREL